MGIDAAENPLLQRQHGNAGHVVGCVVKATAHGLTNEVGKLKVHLHPPENGFLRDDQQSAVGFAADAVGFQIWTKQFDFSQQRAFRKNIDGYVGAVVGFFEYFRNTGVDDIQIFRLSRNRKDIGATRIGTVGEVLADFLRSLIDKGSDVVFHMYFSLRKPVGSR